jgi:drug/metabolite transporter (DMT)-like permease
MKDQKNAYIYALIAVLNWATVASAFKIALKRIDYLNMLLYSSLVSLIIFTLIIFFQKKTAQLRNMPPKSILKSAFLGFLNPFAYYIILFKAYSILPAQEAMILNYFWPVMVVLVSIPILKEKITVKAMLGILTSFLGIIVIVTKGDVIGFRISNPYGATLAISSALFWAIFWILNVKDKRDETIKLFLNFCFGTFYIFLALILTKGITIPSFSQALPTIYIGIMEMGITFIFWLKALQLSKTTAKVSRLIYLTPFLSLLMINIVINERIAPSSLIGLLLIISGIIIQKSSSRRQIPIN